MCMKTPKKDDPKYATEFQNRIRSAKIYLTWLEYAQDSIKRSELESTALKKALRMATEDKFRNHLPEDIVESCERLAERFENMESHVDDTESNHGDSDAEVEVTSTTLAGTAVASIPLPPPAHPIYGRNGILHGTIMSRGKNNRIVRRLNPSLPKKPAAVFGHNGIALGSWYPLQLSAIFYGAHGSKIGGIYGDAQLGAYSIVVANSYGDLDRDEGDIIHYSGSNSHENTDPTRPAESTRNTSTLKASLRVKNPVRVLRSGGSTTTRNAHNDYLPEAGLRYDGLYEVVRMETPQNRNGGLFEQFVLQRLPGQTPLSELRRASPTAQQLRDLREIQQGY